MTKFQILTTDPLVQILRKAKSKGELSSVILESGNNKFLFDLTIDSTIEDVLSSDQTTFEEYAFLFSHGDRVGITQNTSYNSVKSLNTAQLINERGIKSIYYLTPPQLRVIQENAVSGVFSDPISNLEQITKSTDNRSISLSENLDKSQIYKTKNHFPFHVNIRFVEAKNNFYKLLHENGLYQLMIEAFNRAPFDGETFLSDVGETKLRTLSLDVLFSSIEPNSNEWEVAMIPEEQYDWSPELDALDLQVARMKVRQFITENAPDYKSMLFGDKDPQYEVICYKIEKYGVNQQTPIQVFYVPASDKNNDFIDTQINFRKEYVYKIYAIGIGLTSKYAYQTTFNTSKQATVEVIQDPVAKIFEVPLLEQNIKIQGICPTQPEVAFLNRSNQEKTMRFYFEPSVFEKRENFIPIQESDLEFISNAKTDAENKTIFKLGQDSLTYQIFKLNQKPNSYEDFSNALMAEVESKDNSSSEIYETFLTPNRKFYFMFRAKNGFNLFSNPTPIYELELVQDSDETRVVAKTIEFANDKMMRTKTFGRFLRIYPSFRQVLINDYTEIFENLPLADPVSNSQQPFTFNNKKYFVGESEKPIWGKKMKFRVRSRNTGKIIDINVDFVLEKIQTEADF